MIDPKEYILRSKTYRNYEQVYGRCSECGEMCEILLSCCGKPVHFEGEAVNPDHLWTEIYNEIYEVNK